MSLRLRLAVVTTLVTLVVVGLAGAALIALVAREERDRLDDDLAGYARVAATRTVAELRSGRVDKATAQPASPRRTSLDLVARVRLGDEVLLDFGEFPSPEDDPAADGYSTVRVEDDRWRVLSEPLTVALPNVAATVRGMRTDDLTVEVAQPMAASRAAVDAVGRQVVRLGLLAVVVAAALGWALGGAVLRPLGRLRRDAERVSGTDDLEVRVADRQGLREVDELGRSLNLMLDRILQATGETAVALEASRAFAANAAHELRTPLTSIQANIDVLERNPALDLAERATILADIQHQQQRLLRLLSALRLLARGDLERVPGDDLVDLADTVESAAARARSHHADARFDVTLDSGPWLVRGWDEGLQVMVDNLLDNAAVHGRSATGRSEVRVRVVGGPQTVAVVVDDAGPGIAPEEREAVLERFGRARGTTAPGSGLGLALVQQQAVLHGGRVEVSTSPGGGARLSVMLPALPTRPVPSADQPAS